MIGWLPFLVAIFDIWYSSALYILERHSLFQHGSARLLPWELFLVNIYIIYIIAVPEDNNLGRQTDSMAADEIKNAASEEPQMVQVTADAAVKAVKAGDKHVDIAAQIIAEYGEEMNGQTWSSDEEKKLIRRVDWRLIPIVILFLASLSLSLPIETNTKDFGSYLFALHYLVWTKRQSRPLQSTASRKTSILPVGSIRGLDRRLSSAGFFSWDHRRTAYKSNNKPLSTS